MLRMDAKEQLLQELIIGGYLKTPRVVDAFRAIARADFVLSENRREAYENYPLPIGFGQTISQPLTVAFMLELLEPQEGERVLDIGAGSGWTMALLAHIVSEKSQISNLKSPNFGKVIASERIEELCEYAKRNIEKYGFISSGVVELHCQDATAAIPDGRYDKIIAAAAALKDIPEAWRRALKIGGRIVAPIGGSIWRFTKQSETKWKEEEFPGFAFVPLVTEEPRIKKRELKTENAEKQNKHTRTDASNISMGRIKKYRALIVFFITLLAVGCWLLAYQIYWPHADFIGSKSISIEQGSGSRRIAELLKQEGVIDSKWAFVTYVSLKGGASDLKPGVYIWNNNITIPELTRDLTRGGTNERTIAIPEGWTAREIAARMSREHILSSEDFLRLSGKDGMVRFRQEFSFLADAPKTVGLEGYLFPDTYRIFRNASAGGIISKMLANFDKKLTAELRQEITRRKKTVFDIVRMASLIEKEVVSDDDRAMISGILWKRLRLDIPLQVDATVVYAKQLTTDNRQPTTRVTIEDTKIDSLYNTYKYYGLPPGPIANPGISAIRAAIYPQESPYLYYLSAPDGTTIFSRTLDEHNAAVVKYLK
jgi:protein-L-isoaspartate(D-aspartate) O-methyltransferase